MARQVRGKWRTTKQEFCWTWIKPADAEECFTVERHGSETRFLRDGYESLYGTLVATKTPAKKGKTQ